ncbi:uncharacterized protein PAC_02538 [Phialocephala subalpina]|uniref:Uncharacterized protein n=1 Tax=Phialocephala subalpina TaxID=576137 RepID=A0A1L7WIR4_9HELO|nr:uncharacterized protein PAC_02538 [Phialocephala subalpina]
MYQPHHLLVLAFGLGTLTQARVLSPRQTSNTTSTSTVSPTPSSTPIVIAGSCAQDTLQYCCPQVQATLGEDSVDFASACMNGNLPASFDCFFAFQDICCGGSSDENGNSCEIVPPDDICASGAAGSISSLGAVAGASTVTETVDCTAAPTSTSSTAATTTSSSSSISTADSTPATPTPVASSSTTSDSAPTTTPPPSLHRRDTGNWIGALGLSQKLNYQSQYSNAVQSLAWDIGKQVAGCEIYDAGLVCGWEWSVVKTVGVPNIPWSLETITYGVGAGGGGWIETPVTKIS